MDVEGNVLFVNKAFTNTFGYTQFDLKGKNFRIFFTPKDQMDQLPQKELQQVAEAGHADDKNYFVKKDDSFLWVSGESVLITSAHNERRILKLLQDISGQKKAELAARQAHDLNESMLTTIDDIVILLNNQLNVVKANTAFYSLFSNPGSSALIADFTAFIAPYDRKGELISNLKNTLATRKPFTNLELEVAAQSGDRVFNITGRPLKDTQLPDGILLVIHEITIQKQAEREREDIIGFVAHELRNPLSNVILCNEVIKEAISSNDLVRSAEIVQRSQNNIFRLNKMITDLYDATKIHSGNFVLEINEFDFDEMIKEAIDTVQVLQPAFKIMVNGTAGQAAGDRHRLIQVVTNYLSNGIKYSNGSTTILLNVSVTGGIITVAVTDRGLGIPATQLPYIFDRFFRTEKTKDLEGIGLGLFLCRRIIEAHNGRVWAESEEGQGSVFYFSIPVARFVS
ncbi:MAG: histidine kinase [Ferruginibacter sp.]|nr:histidine kinase [Ferruginibacter sp.]